jgi:hypothetical protein
MTFSIKKLATTIAWGLAFESAAEQIVAGVFGARAGAMFGRGHSPDEVAADQGESLAAWQRYAPPLAGAVGLALGLAGRLPGTQSE